MKKMILSGLILFSLCARAQVGDRQAEYKEAFERAQAFHDQKIKKVLFEKPASVESQQLTFGESIKVKGTRVSSGFDNVKSYLVSNFNKISHVVKRQWRSMAGVKSNPPLANGLFYVFLTGGAFPEVNWFVDGAYDTDGTIQRYEFDFGDGTAMVIPSTDIDGARSISHIYDAAGTYTASVKIVDNDGDFSIYSGAVTVSHTNQLPVPKFTLQNNQVPNFLKVDFAAQATDDTGILRYTWKYGDGSADTVGATATTASRTYVNPGLYTVGLVVRDIHRGQNSAYTQAYVGQHQPSGGMYPVPLVFADGLAGVAPLTVNFDGEKSFDIGGSIVTYEWNFGSFSDPRNISYEAKPTFKYQQPGTYYASLKVTDNGGRTNTKYFAVAVSPATGSPQPAEILAVPSYANRSFSFDSNYHALHASVLSYYQIWDFGDGTPVVKGNYPYHVYASDGVYTVTLKLYDLKGHYQQIQKTLTVNSNQSAPASYFNTNTSNAIIGESVNFTTGDPNFVSPTTTAIWDFGDGTLVTGLHKDYLNVSHSYATKGFYLVSLRVTDQLGKSSVYSAYVNVQETQRPVRAEIKLSAHTGLIPLPVRFDGASSWSSAGPIVKYYWQVWASNGTQYNHNKVWTNTLLEGGERYVTLFVEDNQGNIAIGYDYVSAIDSSQVPPSNQNPQANIRMDFLQTGETSNIYLGGYGSWDPDGDRVASYDWIFDGSHKSSDPAFALTSVGHVDHMISLKVTDRWGAIGEQKIVFKNPWVSFDSSPQRPVIDAPVYFVSDAQTLFLPNSQATEFKWDFGDGTPVAYGAQLNHTYTNPGNYSVKLVLTDNLGRTYTAIKQVVVEAVLPLEAVITAKDPNSVLEASGSQIFSWNTFPINVTFDLTESSVQGSGVQSATWDFGDGNTGFGLNPSYNYQKPGTYTVTVTATDSQNSTDTATMQVVVGNWNCSETDGIDGCLKLINSDGHTLPMSETEWIITHDTGGAQTWDPEVGDTDYVQITPLDAEEATPINITSAVIVNGVNLKIQKSGLQTLGVDFTKPYQITVQTKLSDASDYGGAFPQFYFGVGSMNITANEAGIKLTVSATNGYKKYIDLGLNTTYALGDLPVGTYTVVAEKGLLSEHYNVTISNSTAQSLIVDLSVSVLEKNKAKREAALKGKNYPDIPQSWYSKMKGIEVQDDPPPTVPYLGDWCGNVAPFPWGISRPLPPTGVSQIFFGSGGRGEVPVDLPIDKKFGGKLKFYCAIYAGYHKYSQMKWLNYDGFERCRQGPDPIPPEAYTGWYQWKAMTAPQPNYPITLNWKIADEATGKAVSGKYTSSLATIMADEGMTPENITSKVGYIIAATYFGGPKFEHTVNVPKDMLRPKLTVEFDSYHFLSNTSDAAYGVNCTLDKVDEVLPKIENVSAIPQEEAQFLSGQDPLPLTPDNNGDRFGKLKFFPIGVDDVMEDHFLKPDSFKAKLLVELDSGTYQPLMIDKVKVNMKYDGKQKPNTLPKIYNILPENRLPVKAGSTKFKVKIVIDAKDFANEITYVPGELKKIELEFIPMGVGIDEAKVGKKVISNITPLFNAKTYESILCKNGIYNPEKTVMYGDPDLLNRIHKLANPTQGDPMMFRCNDISLPWGGEFDTKLEPGKPEHEFGHKFGKNIDIRYFNTTLERQDAYDDNRGRDRIKDVNTYSKLSEWAYKVATGAAGYSSKKSSMLATCTTFPYLAPCTSGSQDLTKEEVLQLCQWHTTFESLCAEEAPGYRAALANYSDWIEHNSQNLLKIKKHFQKVIMSGGTAIQKTPGVPATMGIDWQLLALTKGQWIDGSSVYKKTILGISTEKIDVCYNGDCVPEDYFKTTDTVHINHMHLEVYKKVK